MSTTQSPFAFNRGEMFTRTFREHWPLLLAEGIILALLGVAAIVVPPIAGLVTTVFVGLVLLAAGIVGLITTIQARGMPGFWWSLISAILAIIAGGLLIWNPILGMISLTSLMTGFFIADGIVTIFLSLRHRDKLVGRWQLLLVNGIIDLIIAGLIIWGLPGTLVWALGLLVGIDLVFGGTTLIAMAFRMREQATELAPAAARHAA
jgi:uncharacterized membrane protein HdeD (DUF308 family)